MPSNETLRERRMSDQMQKALNLFPDAWKVKERYRTIYYAMKQEYPNLLASHGKETMLMFMRDCIYLDRKLRKLTEGQDQEVKNELEIIKQRELEYNV